MVAYEKNVRIHPLHTILILNRVLLRFFRILAVAEGQKQEIGQLWNVETYPDGKSLTEPSEPPEFRRFLDLRIEFLVSQMMLA